MFLADDFFHGTLPWFFGGSPWEHWAAFPVTFSTGWPVLSLVFQGFAPCRLLFSAVLPSFMWPSGARSNMAPGRLSTERATVGLQNAQASSALTLSGSMATPSSHSPTLPLSYLTSGSDVSPSLAWGFSRWESGTSSLCFFFLHLI